MTVEAMKKQIVNTVREIGNGTSFVELERRIDGMAGELSLGFDDSNLYLWFGVSPLFVESFRDLTDNGTIEINTTVPLVYAIDGKMPDVSVAHRPNKKYKHPHWLPVSISLPRGVR